MESTAATSLEPSPAVEDPPVDLVIAQQRLMKLGMYTRYAPASAQYLRDCIAHELERAERILLERLGYSGVQQHLLDILEARSALARSWH